jgi:hypothetical protein
MSFTASKRGNRCSQGSGQKDFTKMRDDAERGAVGKMSAPGAGRLLLKFGDPTPTANKCSLPQPTITCRPNYS